MNKSAPFRRVVVVGASAGGLEPLSTLLERLPATLESAVCVVSHMAAHTPSSLHHILARRTALPVAPAQDGEELQAGRVYIGVADRHLMIREGAARLTRGPKESRSRPAIDVLFRSAAMCYGRRVIGVMLSGMLDDGTAGLWAVKDQKGVALVQDPEQAQYPSMPTSAIQHVDVDLVGPVEAISEEIMRLDKEPIIDSEAPAPLERHVLENDIAGEANALRGGVMGLGKVSQYTCPDCHGVLVQIEEGPILRFRCHTGHAFSIKSLLVEVTEAIDNGLWDTIRALEERVLLLRQMSELAAQIQPGEIADRSRAQADHIEKHIKTLRDLVLDSEIFGHSSGG